MSAAGLFGVGINFFMIGGACLVLSKAVDYIYNLGMFMLTEQDAINTLTYLRWIFIAIPFLYLLLEVINHLVVANSETSGEV